MVLLPSILLDKQRASRISIAGTLIWVCSADIGAKEIIYLDEIKLGIRRFLLHNWPGLSWPIIAAVLIRPHRELHLLQAVS